MSIRVGIRGMRRDFAMYCPALYIVCRIFSVDILCTMPIEELTIQPASTYFLCIEEKEYLTISPASTYSLVVT